MKTPRILLLSLLLAQGASAVDVIKTWTGASNNGLNNVDNWDNNQRPTFGAAANTDALLFTGGGTGTVNINVDATAKSITFSGPLAYTFGGASPLRLGDTSTGTTQPNTGAIVNDSEQTVILNTSGGLFFRFGSLEAAAGPITVNANTPVDIGHGAATSGRNLLATGAFNVTVQSVLAGLGSQETDGGHLIKDGENLLLLNGNSATWNGRIFVHEGAVRVSRTASLGTTLGDTTLAGGESTARVEITGNVSVDEPFQIGGRVAPGAAALINLSGNNILAGPITLNEDGEEFAIRADAGVLDILGAVAYGSAAGETTLRLGGAGVGAFFGPLAAAGEALSVVKQDEGTWALLGPSAFTGTITASAGRLELSATHTGGGALVVEEGASLTVHLAEPEQTLAASSVTLAGTEGGTTLVLDLGSIPTTSAPVLSTSGLTLIQSVGVGLKSTNLGIGQIPLIAYEGEIGGDGFAALALTDLPARVTAALVHDEANSRVLLDISGFDQPRWTGATDAIWDADDGTGTGTFNWREVVSGQPTRYLQGEAGTDAVLFDDTATGSTEVQLTGELTPLNVRVSNDTLSYSFVGPGNLAGSGGLLKEGAGTLRIANETGNTFTGLTHIAGGTLIIGDGVNNGRGSLGSGSILNDGILLLDRPDTFTLTSAISGSGSLIKQSGGIAILAGNSDFTGPVTIAQGTLRLGTGGALGAPSENWVTVEPGATLDVRGQLLPSGKVVSVSGAGVGGAGAVINSGGGGGAAVGLRHLVFTGPATIGGGARWDIRDQEGGVQVNGHDLIKAGTQSVFWANLGETGIGSLLITGNGSRLVFEGSTTLGSHPGVITVEGGATLGFEGSTAENTKPIVVAGGTINFSGGTTNVLASQITIDGDATVNTATNVEAVASGKITGNGNLIKTTNGVFKVTGDDNDYTGYTENRVGQLWIGNDGSTGSLPPGDIYITAGNILIRRYGVLELGQNIHGAGGINIQNVAYPELTEITLSGDNTFTGAVTLARGTLRITNSSALGAGEKLVSIQGARPTLILDGGQDGLTLSPEFTIRISSDGPLGGIQNLSGDNVIESTILLFAQGGGNSRLRGDGGSLTLNGSIRIVPYADHNGTSGNRQLQLDGDIGGVINGAVENVPEDTINTGTTENPNIVRRLLIVSKQGAGTWVLNAENTYEGSTLIAEGTLKLGPEASIAASSVINLAAGAILDVSEQPGFTLINQTLNSQNTGGTIAGNLTLGSAATLNGQGVITGDLVIGPGSIVISGAAYTPGVFTINGDLDLAGGQANLSLTSDTTPGGANDLLSVGGDLKITAPSSIELFTDGFPLGGAYTLVEYDGEFEGDLADITLINPTHYDLALDVETEPGKLLLVVSGAPASLVWTGNPAQPENTGAAHRTWNAANAYWHDGSGGANFAVVDQVTFDDTAHSSKRNVVIAGLHRPSSIVVDTSDEFGYTFTTAATVNDNGIVGAASLTKLGTGILTFATTGAFNATGKTTILGGKIVLAANQNGFTQTRWIELYAGTVLDVSARAAGFNLGNLANVERVLSGIGSVAGTLQVGGISVVKPGLSSDPDDQATAGDQIGALTIGSLRLPGNAEPGAPRVVLQIGGPTGQVEDAFDTVAIADFADIIVEGQHDQLLVTDVLALDVGSTIRLELVNEYVPEIGDVFNLANWTELITDIDGDENGFDPLAAASFELPVLPEGLYWNRSLFLEHGIVFISQAPAVVGEITFDPAAAVNPGAVVTLSASVSGLEPYTYQWRFNGADIPLEENATAQSPQLVLTAAEALEGDYTLVVSNPIGSGFSPPAFLSVNDPVQILAHPQDLTRDPGQPATFSVSASGTAPLGYQWRKNGEPIPGEESDSFTLPAVAEDDEGAYDVIVTNVVGPVTSAAAALSVNDPVSIVQQPASQGVFQGVAATFAVQVSGTGPFTYRWQKNGADIPGEAAAQPSLVIGNVIEADEGAYSVRVTNSVNSVTSAAAALLVGTATPKIVSQTPSQIVAVGSAVTLQADVIGLPPLAYQWFKAGRPVKGATAATLTLPAAQIKDAGAYRVQITGGAVIDSANIELGVVDAAARDVPLALNAAAKLEAKAAGNGLLFAWSKDGEPLAETTRVKGVDKTVLTIGKPLEDADTGLYTLTVTGLGGSALTTAGHSLKVFSEPPVITEDPPAFPDAIVSGSFTYQIPVDPNPKKAPTGFAAKGLPPGLKLDKKSGLISGKPTAVSKDPLGYLVTLTASNSAGKATVQGRILVQVLNPVLAGTYAAPVGRHPVLNGGLGGRLDLKITVKGATSGKLVLGTASHTLRGVLDTTPGSQAGQAVLTIARKGGAPPLTLTLDFDGANRITNADLTDGDSALAFTGWRNVWDRKANPAIPAFAAYHTFALEIPNHIGVADVPQGNGYGSVTLAPAGTLRITGKLADGEAFTGSAFTGPEGEAVVFQTRYKTKEKGSVAGWLDLNDASISLGGELTWTRPANPAPKHTLYRNGFPGVVDLVPVGGPYTPPADPKVFLNLDPGDSNAVLSFASGGIEGSVADPADLDLPASIAAKSKAAVITDPAKNPRKTTLSLTPRTGLFKGAADLEDAGSGASAKRRLNFLGIAVPESGGGHRGHGYFLLNGITAGSDTLSGQVTLDTIPPLP